MSAPLPLTLPEAKRAVVHGLLTALRAVHGVLAVVLGGSYARGTQHAGSDVDLGLYYVESDPFAVDDIRHVAQQVAAGACVVTELYEWGPWVNGGAWIPTRAGKVDFLYRNVDQVRRVIRAAHAGKVELHFNQQPPFGFHSVIYLGETSIALPLYDPASLVAALKVAVAPYPSALKHTIIREYLWATEFTLLFARDFAQRADVYNTVGCLTRALSYLMQVLFALNATYFVNDKGVLEAIDAFALRPPAYGSRVRDLLCRPGVTPTELAATVAALDALFRDVVGLAGDAYRPKYAV